MTSLVETVALNYIALHTADPDDVVTAFETAFPNHSLGSSEALKEMMIFNSLSTVVAGTITGPFPGGQ